MRQSRGGGWRVGSRVGPGALPRVVVDKVGAAIRCLALLPAVWELISGRGAAEARCGRRSRGSTRRNLRHRAADGALELCRALRESQQCRACWALDSHLHMQPQRVSAAREGVLQTKHAKAKEAARNSEPRPAHKSADSRAAGGICQKSTLTTRAGSGCSLPFLSSLLRLRSRIRLNLAESDSWNPKERVRVFEKRRLAVA